MSDEFLDRWRSPLSLHDCIVIGGGISGLGVAARLEMEGKNVLVLERADRPGGTMAGVRADGYVIDFGPTTILHTTTLIDDLVRYAGVENALCFASDQSKRRFVVREGKMHPLPTGAGAFIFSTLFSFKAKMRLLGEPFVRRNPNDESIAEFTQRRLGREFLDYAISPFVSGVYAGDPAQLSVKWALPKIHNLEKNYGSLLKGAVQGRRSRKRNHEISGEARKDRAHLVSFTDGVTVLPQALAARLGKRIVLGAKLETLTRSSCGYSVTYSGPQGPVHSRSRSLVFAIPAYELDPYMKMCQPSYEGDLAAIRYAPVTQVFLGFRREQVMHPLRGFGALMPQRENRRILGVLWNSSLFPSRAPLDHVALTVFLGGMMRPEMVDLDEVQILSICLDEIAPLLGVRGSPAFWRVKRWRRAIPQYELGYGRYLGLMETFEAHTPGAFLCGNFRGGVAVGDCIIQSHLTAARVMEFLAAA